MELSRPFIQLPFKFDVDRLKQELDQFETSTWMAHPSRMTGNSAIPLISLNGEDNDDFSGRMMATPHLLRCEYMQQVMASFGEVLARSRLMKLAAGTEVSPHIDFNYHWYSRVRIHVPITTFPEVTFYCGDEQRHMAAGECWIFDSWRQHRVTNESNQDRVHLVIDTAGSSRFWRLVRQLEQTPATDFESIDYIPNKQVQIRTERHNVAPVMAPGELEALAKELIGDFMENPENDPKLVAHYRDLLMDLAKDWREVWHLYGSDNKEGRAHYQALLSRTMKSLHPRPRALVTASNNVGVNPIIVQRILRVALGGQD